MVADYFLLVNENHQLVLFGLACKFSIDDSYLSPTHKSTKIFPIVVDMWLVV
jgi:hypothetical protein